MNPGLDFKVKCPYCGFENRGWTSGNRWSNSSLTTCDSDDGGCGKDFVYDIKLSVKVTTYTLSKAENDG